MLSDVMKNVVMMSVVGHMWVSLWVSWRQMRVSLVFNKWSTARCFVSSAFLANIRPAPRHLAQWHSTKWRTALQAYFRHYSINDTQHYDILLSLCWVSLCWVSLCWVSLCWVSLCWVSLCWMLRRRYSACKKKILRANTLAYSAGASVTKK